MYLFVFKNVGYDHLKGELVLFQRKEKARLAGAPPVAEQQQQQHQQQQQQTSLTGGAVSSV